MKQIQELTIEGRKLIIDNSARIWDAETGDQLKKVFNKRVGYDYVYVKTKKRKTGKHRHKYGRTYLVHRLVCMAFHPKDGCSRYEDYSAWDTDHIDHNKRNNIPSNLRFVSRSFNNRRRHANMLRAKNGKHTQHRDVFVKAESIETGEVRYFLNGHQFALWCGCSRPMAYYALDGKGSVYGWRLTYIPREADEVKEFKAKHDEAEMERRLRRVKKAHDKKMRTLSERAWKKSQLEKAYDELYKSGVFGWQELAMKIGELKRDFHVVQQIDPKTEELVKEWSSVYAAECDLGLTTIGHAVKQGDEGGLAGGFVWRYKISRSNIDTNNTNNKNEDN